MRASSLIPAFLAAGCTAGMTGGGGGDDTTGDDVGEEPCEIAEPTGGVSTLAGCDRAGDADGDRDSARFSNPVNVAAGAGGEVYVADFDNGKLRVVEEDGAVWTLVAQEGFERPFAVERAGDVLYVATDRNDRGEHSSTTGTIWRVDLDGGAATVVVRDVGRPRGLLALPDGRLVLSDYQHHAIRVLDPDSGVLVDLAGTFGEMGMADARGADARFASPYGLALAPDGRILVADYDNNRIRAVAMDGEVVTLAGGAEAGDADGPLADARFDAPQDLVVVGDAIYVADTGNFTIRKIAGGEVTTVAGSGEAGYLDSADLRAARFHGLEGIAASPDAARLVVADGSRGEDLPYHRVRAVELP